MRRRSAGLPAAEALARRLQEAEQRWGLLAGAESVLVACSGGPDSLALLHLLWSRRGPWGLRLGVAHLDHGLRGEQSTAEAAWVAELAASLGLPLHAERVDVSELAGQERLSLEAAARRARYRFLEQAAEAGTWDRVALGHTASDRAETVLLNVLRGAGLHGLRGIPARRGRFVRPLILATREQTEAYCREQALEPREDPTNRDPSYARRNRVRLELIPHLRREYNPRLETALLRLAEAAEAELDWTEPQIRAALEGVLRPAGAGIALDRDSLREMSPGLRYRVLRAAWTRLTGDSADLDLTAYRRLERLVERAGTGRCAPLPGDFQARIGYNVVRLGRRNTAEVAASPLPQWPLPEQGMVRLPNWGLTVRLERLDQPAAELGDARGRQTVIDADQLALPLLVRPWRPGDMLKPLGMSGHKKVQDLFTDRKVPREQRGRVPLIVDSAGQIVWVVGCALAEAAKVTPTTRRWLRLTVEPTPPGCDRKVEDYA